MDTQAMKQELSKHTLWLRAGDFKKLGEYYPLQGSSLIIRTLVAKHIEKLEARVTDAPINTLEIDV